MRIRNIGLIAVLSAVLAGSAVAASPARDPSEMMLRKGDFPANAKYNWGQMPPKFTKGLAHFGVKSSSVYVYVTIPTSPTKYKSVSGLVVVTASAAQAKTAYGALKQDFTKGSKSVLRLPAYGDEQVARHEPSKASLLVRRSRVVWELELSGEGLLVIPKPALLEEFQMYAAKQKARVGSG
jgi:hypothetical protein